MDFEAGGRKNGEKRLIKTDMSGDFNCDPKSRGVRIPSATPIFCILRRRAGAGLRFLCPENTVFGTKTSFRPRFADGGDAAARAPPALVEWLPPLRFGTSLRSVWPRRSPENRLNEKHTPVPVPTSYARENPEDDFL